MNCRGAQEQILLYPESRLDDQVRDHLAHCEVCRLAQQENRKLHRIMTQQSEPPRLLETTVIEEMVERGLQKIRPITRSGLPWVRLAVAACFVLGIGISISHFFIRTGTHTPARDYEVGSTVSIGAKDSVIFASQSYALLAGADSRLVMGNLDSRSIDLSLIDGEVIIVARHGAYDSLSVHAGPFAIQALGTFFRVHRRGDTTHACVFEGKVRISGPTLSSPVILESGRHLKLTRDNTREEALSSIALTRQEEASALLSRVWDFGAFCPDDDPAEAHDVFAGKPEKEKSSVKSAGDKAGKGSPRSSPCDSAFPGSGQQAAIERALCLERMGRPNEALILYEELYRTGSNAVRERALHRISRLLFRTVGDFEKAEVRIREYLGAYPRGRWREYEMHYLIQILKSRGELVERAELMHRFILEFPNTCPSRVYRRDLLLLSSQSGGDRNPP